MMTDDQLTPTEKAPEEVSGESVEHDVTEAPVATAVAEPAVETPTPEDDSAQPTAEAEAHAPAEEVTAHSAPTTPEVPQPIAEKPAATEVVANVNDADLFEQAMADLESGEDSGTDGGYKKLSRGDRVEATVIQVDRDRVFVDLGTKSEGIVPLSELSEENIEDAKDHIKVGDRIQVVVIKPQGGDGNALVSKKKADFEDAWDHIEQTFNEGKMIKAQVIDRVKGGLVVDIGVRGFVPATHVGGGRLRNIEKFVGETLDLKIIEIDRDRKKVVLSNREAEEQARKKAKEEIFTKVAPGEILDGTVRRLTEYGAFVDLGGVDGLLHISEMSWMRINNPREMFKEGQKIKVMVLRLDPGAGKISLGHRQVLPDPWTLIRQNYTSGQKLTCKISRIVMSGAFVKLPEGAEAFMPVSEMSNRRLKSPNEVVEEGQEVEVQIIDLRPDERRMVLSMRALGGGEVSRPGGGGGAPAYDDDFGGKKGKKPARKGAKGGRGRDEEDFEDVVGRRGYATGGATIGERLGMLKGFLTRDDEDGEDEAAAPTGDAEAEPTAPEPADES